MASLDLKYPEENQLRLWGRHDGEDERYLSKQLITCIGNKRALLAHLDAAVRKVKARLNKDKLRVFDAFSGSGIVSRFLKQHASLIVSNDLERYAAVSARCFLSNKSRHDLSLLDEIINDLNARVDSAALPTGFIEELYAPRSELKILASDRVFYTKKNARRLDTYRRLLEEVDASYRDLLLGPLLSKASVHANTSGVFKGFYKDGKTKVGKFGGTNGDALKRILGEIKLEAPILSRFECDCEVYEGDANETATKIPSIDLAYFDPPYNQHPYGSNYFMLNLLVDYKRPMEISRVSGIPNDWRRSDYNVRSRCLPRFTELLHAVDSRFLLISFNNEGFIAPSEMKQMLARLGRVETFDIPYNAFRGSRNFDNRSIHVTEHLYLVDRHGRQ